MPITNRYQTTGEQAIASYDYFALSESRGYKIFYGTSEKASSSYLGTTGTETYKLVENPIFSNSIETSGSLVSTSSTATKSQDLNFDITFNRPQIIDGLMPISFSFGVNPTVNSISGSTHFNIYHYDGTTETLLVSGGTPINDVGDFGGSGTKEKVTKTIVLDVPQRLFKSGETLRVNVEGWVTGNSGTGRHIFAHDPKDRDGDFLKPSTDKTDTTIFQVHVPFKIQT